MTRNTNPISTIRPNRRLSIFLVLIVAFAFSFLTACPSSSGSDTEADAGDGGGYSISYNANGATAGAAPADTKKYAAGDSATALGKGSLACDFHGFSGWNTKADGSGTGYGAGDAVKVESDMTLYAQWTINEWAPLGLGLDSDIYALTRDSSGNIYAGGEFSTVGGVSTNNIAKWNGSTWVPLAEGDAGTEGDVGALSYGNGKLYAGGSISAISHIDFGRIAGWSEMGWFPLRGGVDNRVFALVCDSSGNLYAGGLFEYAGDEAVNYVAKWDESEWSPLKTGLDKLVVSLACDSSGNLYAGGAFIATNDGITALNCIAMWNGSAWSDLGGGMNNIVCSLACCKGKLYAGGDFTMAGGERANHIAVWDGSRWSPLGDGINIPVQAIACDSSGNLFTHARNKEDAPGKTKSAPVTECIMQWNGSSWATLSGPIDGQVKALACDSMGNLYVGGSFTAIGGVEANGIAVLKR
jgi:hypothetical protein